MSMTKERTPRGHHYVRMHSSGVVSAADADALSQRMAQGSEFSNQPILAIVERGTEYSPEARQSFTQLGKGNAETEHEPIAIVVFSAPMRVMLSFIIRITGNAPYTRFFGAEPDALAWLEDQLLAKAS
jgi:hypothetical protein